MQALFSNNYNVNNKNISNEFINIKMAIPELLCQQPKAVRTPMPLQGAGAWLG